MGAHIPGRDHAPGAVHQLSAVPGGELLQGEFDELARIRHAGARHGQCERFVDHRDEHDAVRRAVTLFGRRSRKGTRGWTQDYVLLLLDRQAQLETPVERGRHLRGVGPAGNRSPAIDRRHSWERDTRAMKEFSSERHRAIIREPARNHNLYASVTALYSPPSRQNTVQLEGRLP